MEIFLSALLKKILPDPCFQKAFWVMNLGMKFITVAEKRDGENFISALGKSIGYRRCFFCF